MRSSHATSTLPSSRGRLCRGVDDLRAAPRQLAEAGVQRSDDVGGFRSTIVTGATSTWAMTGVLTPTVVLPIPKPLMIAWPPRRAALKPPCTAESSLPVGFQAFDDQCLDYSSPEVSRYVKKLGFMGCANCGPTLRGDS